MALLAHTASPSFCLLCIRNTVHSVLECWDLAHIKVPRFECVCVFEHCEHVYSAGVCGTDGEHCAVTDLC